MLSSPPSATQDRRILHRLRAARKFTIHIRTVRPSLLDLRFTGDPWVVGEADGTAALCLDDYRLVGLALSSVDLPSFNQRLFQMRHRRPRPRTRPAQ
jgi:hypothetical protein